MLLISCLSSFVFCLNYVSSASCVIGLPFFKNICSYSEANDHVPIFDVNEVP